MIAKDGTITTKGELIAEKGIRTDEIKSLTDDGQVTINNLTINNLTIEDKYLEIASNIFQIASSIDTRIETILLSKSNDKGGFIEQIKKHGISLYNC